MSIAAVDIETSDPHLKDLGIGAIRNDGRILTVGIYCPDWGIDGWYTWDQLLEDDEALELLEDKEVTKVFHNGLYDLNWLCLWGRLKVNNIDDTLTRESLLDAYQYSYSLDNCCTRHGVTGKNKGDTIDAWWTNHGGKGKAIEHLAEIPVDVVGKYNLQDCHATYDLWQVQQPLLEKQGLLKCLGVENRLYGWLLKAKKVGIRIDGTALKDLTDKIKEIYTRKLFNWQMAYDDVNFNSTVALASLFNKLGIPIPQKRNGGGNTFDADSLSDIEHPIGQQIIELRALKKLLGTYLEGQLVTFNYKDHLHSDLHPAKSDEGGTITGRFSASNPNVQNISAREEKFGNEVRSLFIPEDGCILGAFDYKQIEYRVFTHFAVALKAPGTVEVKKQFHDNPDTDYHAMGQKLMGWYFEDDPHKTKMYRHIMKNLGFGKLYGLGAASFAHKFRHPLRMSHPDYKGPLKALAEYLIRLYEQKVPFIKPTCDKIMRTGEKRGYVRGVSGRMLRLRDVKVQGGNTRCYQDAYKLVNYICQGSAGDIIKKAIADSWDAGVWDVLIPHTMIHDELVFSIPDTKEGYDACIKLKECMMNAYQLEIPIGVDTEIGPDWGHCNEENWHEFENKWANA